MLTSSEVAIQLSTLIRNVILARSLTKADFGTATLIGTVLSVSELNGRVGVEQWVVQSAASDSAPGIGAAHLCQACFGALGTLILLSVAGPMARLFGVPEATSVFRTLATIPLMRGMSHLDAYRSTRQISFRPVVLVEVLPQIVTTLAAWPLVTLWPTFGAQVALLFGKQVLSLMVSYVVAKTPYRWFGDRDILKSIVRFAWPVTVGAILMFVTTQGDRLAIGAKHTVADLASYAVAATVALLPASTIQKVVGSVCLPHLSLVQQSAVAFQRRLVSAAYVLSLIGGAYGIGMTLSGGEAISLVFGPNYRGMGSLVALLGLSQTMKILRGLPTLAAMAKGDSRTLMECQLLRVAGVAIAFPIAYRGGSLEAIAGCAVGGEVLSLAGGLWRLKRRFGIAPGPYASPLLFAGLFAGLGCITALARPHELPTWICFSITAVAAVIFAAGHLVVFRQSRGLLVSLVQAAGRPTLTMVLFAWISAEHVGCGRCWRLTRPVLVCRVVS
jgi:O-antigen/teichoic acid export membrane protein